MQIRNARAEDVEKILAIYQTYVLNSTVTFEYEAPNLVEFQKRVLEVQTKFPWLVCVQGDEISGYAYAAEPFKRAAYRWNAEVSLYVAEKFQGKQIASALYACLEDFLKCQGYYYLYGVITASNARSLSFFRRLGYQQSAHYRNVGFKLGKWLDVLWLGKNIAKIQSEPQVPLKFADLSLTKQQEIFSKHTKSLNF